MVHIYEKTCKTKENSYGLIELDDAETFKKGPCIITIIAGPVSKKSINGSLRQTAHLINPDIDIKYDKDRRLLGLGFGDYKEKTERFTRIDPNEEELKTFMIKYIYPLIEENSNKIDVLRAMKNVRNLNFVTYCNGAKVFVKIEKSLEQRMIELGYKKLEIALILSQITLAAVSGVVIKKKGTKSLAITFGDVLDEEFEKNPNIFLDNPNIKDRGYIDYNNSLGFGIVEDGEHSFKKHMTENPILKEKIQTFINTSLDNSIYNYYSDKMIEPITFEKIERAFNDLEYKNKRGR